MRSRWRMAPGSNSDVDLFESLRPDLMRFACALEQGVGMIFGRCRRVICGIVWGAPALVLADAQHFDIPAQSLPAALKVFAAQAHVQLLYVYNVVADGRGNAVRGDMDARAALNELLRGTGFEAAYVSDMEVTIRRTSTTSTRQLNASSRGEL